MKRQGVNSFEEVKRKVDILAFIEKSTGHRARRSGKGYTLPECPFCQGHGCFSITPEKQLYNCFQCPGKSGGDIFNYLCKLRGCDKRAALEELAKEAGFELPTSRFAKRDIREEILSQTKEDWSLPEAKDVWEYLINTRRLSPETLKGHDVGFFGDRSRLIGILKKKGFTYDEIKASGILTQGYGTFYQILFGWRAYNGRLSGFIAGATKARLKTVKPEEEDSYPKYKNAADLQVDSPYNLYYAKRRVPEDATLVIVEGILDVLQMLSHGVFNTVALGGTSFKEGFGEALAMTRFLRLIILLDSDKAGKQGTSQLIRHLIQAHPKFTLYVTEITAVDPLDQNRRIKDPDELIIKLGPEVLKKVIRYPAKAGPWLVLAMRDQYDMKNSIDRDRAFEEVASLWGFISDEVERKEVLRYLADGSEMPQEDIRKTIEKYAQRPSAGVAPKQAAAESNKNEIKKEGSSLILSSLAELQRKLKDSKEGNKDIRRRNKVLLRAYGAFVVQTKELAKAGLLWHVNRLSEGHIGLLRQLRKDPMRAQTMVEKIDQIFTAARLSEIDRIQKEIERLCDQGDANEGEG
ncbi:MAG: toprim domain-containing protein [Nitrospirae bacterium]|nr:toprim domain-containing protein [Nitrospirota bacterium]MBI3803505.1 toprim domain-containing protein [Candidatus Manganitrophaceae bacterium]